MDDDAAVLAEMRRQYSQATLEDHMLVDGVVYLRCARCRERPVPKGWSFVALCDPCLKARLGGDGHAVPEGDAAPSPK